MWGHFLILIVLTLSSTSFWGKIILLPNMWFYFFIFIFYCPICDFKNTECILSFIYPDLIHKHHRPWLFVFWPRTIFLMMIISDIALCDCQVLCPLWGSFTFVLLLNLYASFEMAEQSLPPRWTENTKKWWQQSLKRRL